MLIVIIVKCLQKPSIKGLPLPSLSTLKLEGLGGKYVLPHNV